MPEPVNRTLLLFDIEKFGGRDDVEQSLLRRMLNGVVIDALTAADTEPAAQHLEDRGDGLMALIDPGLSKARLLKVLLTEVPRLVRATNRLTASSAQIRLRIVLGSGEVALDPQPGTLGGVVGHDLNQAFRLLNADPLRAALAQSREDTVVCVTDSVYQGVVRHGHLGIDPSEFTEVTALGKEGPITGWLHGAPTGAPTAHPSASAAQPAASASPHKALPSRGSFSFGGSLVMGDQHGVSGGHVTGDVVQGGKTHGDAARDGERR